MTCKEALDWCEQFTNNLVMANVDTKKRALGLQAMQTVKSALEKQIPKKPKNREGTTYFYCPCCDSNNLNEYCGDCGQALDWGDGE